MKCLKRLLMSLFLLPAAFSYGESIDPLIQNKQGLFLAEYTDKTKYIEHGIEVNSKLADEGFVLLKNDGTLPLKKGTKISLCGKSSMHGLARGGSGAAAGSISAGVNSIDLEQSLTSAGFEVNPDLISFYRDTNRSGKGRMTGSDGWRGNSEYIIGETPWANYESNLIESFKNYSDVGIQVISREGSEGCDLKTIDSSDDIKFGFSNKHSLELSDNEKDLFDHLHTLVKKIVIVINSSNPIECDELLKDEKVAGILWIGNPGDVGPGAVGRILSGEVNPSGHLVDTWSRDFTKDPTFQNFGDNRQHGKSLPEAEKLKHQSLDTMFASDGSPMMSFGTDKNYTDHSSPRWLDEENKIVMAGINGVKPASYVSYEEGIYSDYRYYETRYQDKLAKEGKEAADAWYNGEEGVVFPFGYGLSYTSFKQEIARVNPKKNTKLDENNDLVEVSVKVTNQGEVAGKDAVQLYWKAPYYDGQIEKADHVLCAFGKTKLLEPGESQILHLTFHLQDVANYDYSDANKNNFKGYELDAGTYSVLLGKNAHESYDSFDFQVKDGGIQYENDRVTGNKVFNRFTDRGFHSSTPGKNDIEFTNMSRHDFVSSFPCFPSFQDRTVKSGSRFEEFLTHEFNIWDIEEDNNFDMFPKEILVSEEMAKAKGFKQENNTLTKENRIQFSEMRGIKYDDQKWNEFINQMSWSELMRVIEDYRMSSPKIDEIGKVIGKEGDGPQKFSIIWWVSSPIIAATFNPRLAYEQGECISEEAKMIDKNGWWGPSVNIHRSPFAGRNFESYSADPFLTGKMVSEVTSVVIDRGVYVYVRNFGLNNQEKNREGGIVFVNEQAIREIYLKPFQMSVREGKLTGLLGSYQRIGLIECAASYALNTEILRNEWGFKGSILSEMTHSGHGSVNNKCYECVTTRVLSGQSCQLDSFGFSKQSASTWDTNKVWAGGTGAPVYERDGVKHISFTWWNAVREAVKGHMYMTANSTLASHDFVTAKHKVCKTFLVGEQIKINVAEDVKEITSEKSYGNAYSNYHVTYKLNDTSVLPTGLTLKDGVIEGTLDHVLFARFDIIAEMQRDDGAIINEAIKYEIEIVPDMTKIDVDENKDNANMLIIGITSGIVALAAVSLAIVMLLKRKKKEN